MPHVIAWDLETIPDKQPCLNNKFTCRSCWLRSKQRAMVNLQSSGTRKLVCILCSKMGRGRKREYAIRLGETLRLNRWPPRRRSKWRAGSVQRILEGLGVKQGADGRFAYPCSQFTSALSPILRLRVTAGELESGNGPLALGRFLARNLDQRFAVEHHLVIDRANAR